MDLNRRLGCGRLAEIFGERAVGVDSYFRTLGIREFARTKAKILGSKTNLPSLNGVYRGYQRLYRWRW